MFSKTFFTLALSAASILAAPLDSRSEHTFSPSDMSRYNVGTGAIDCTASTGLVSKSPSNHGEDTTTLLTFTYPDEAAGKKCRFVFWLLPGDEASEGAKLDLYTTNYPAPGCTESWPPGNQRDVHLGRLAVGDYNEVATWEETYSTYLTEETDCKEPGTVEGFELVGTNDEILVSWGAGSGPGIVIV